MSVSHVVVAERDVRNGPIQERNDLDEESEETRLEQRAVSELMVSRRVQWQLLREIAR